MSSRDTSGDEGRSISILKLIGALALLALAAWFIFSNVETVAIKLWVGTVSMPMWIALLITFLAGWAFGLLVGAWRRRGKK
ncbi:LapA family protein [Stackebrandtia soli]|uniref:LapA family protein n=1 Tax=Stackebrandtia soli TaxID=1892856 RepID=UPI0039E82697